MRHVWLEELKGTEILAKPVVNLNGKVLLTKGMMMKSSYIEKINEYGISSIYIEDSISEGIEIEDILCEETRIEAKNVIQKEIKRFAKTGTVKMDEVLNMVKVISEQMLSNKSEALINLKDIRLKDEYLFSHSVNVCTLAIYLALKMGYEQSKINHIGMGCLLHDIGKILVSPKILEKKGTLTTEEFELIKKHPLDGYLAIKENIDVFPITKVIVLMHHERIDGTGYPSSLPESKIHESARLCTICDVFDAMSSDLAYNNSFCFSDIVKYLYSYSGKHFDKKLVTEFLKYLPPYPPGTIVLLSNGICAIVISNNPSNLLRPVVRFLFNTKTRVKYGDGKIFDLTDDLTLKIQKEINLNLDDLEKGLTTFIW